MTRIYYFTRTGNSKRIANKLAASLNSTAQEITDGKNWEGILGFIKAGYYTLTKKELRHNLGQIKLANKEKLIIISPLWADNLPPIIRVFTTEVKRENVILVMTSDGSVLKDRNGFNTIYDIVKKNKNEDEIMSKIIQHINTK